MAKPYAKIVVSSPASWDGGMWRLDIETDLDVADMGIRVFGPRSRALARARAWSRRLGNIPVEVEA